MLALYFLIVGFGLAGCAVPGIDNGGKARARGLMPSRAFDELVRTNWETLGEASPGVLFSPRGIAYGDPALTQGYPKLIRLSWWEEPTPLSNYLSSLVQSVTNLPWVNPSGNQWRPLATLRYTGGSNGVIVVRTNRQEFYRAGWRFK